MMTSKRWIALLTGTLVLILSPLLVFYIGFSFAAPDQEEAAKRAWAELGVSLDELPNRFPKTEKNAAAIRTETFAATIGLFADGTAQPLTDTLNEYLKSDAFRAHADATPELPTPLRTLLNDHAGDFDAFYAESLAGEAPVWESDISLYGNAPIPSLALGRAVTNACLLDGVNRAARGDGDGALRAFQTVQKFNSSYRNRPELISQLIANTIDEQLAYTLRKTPSAPPDLVDHLVDPNFRDRMYLALGVESWTVSGAIERASSSKALSEPGADPQSVSIIDRFVYSLSRPYFRYCAAESSSATATSTAYLKSVWPSDAVVSDADPKLSTQLSDWNVLSFAAPSLTQMQRSFGASAFQLEATQMVLRAKDARRAGRPAFDMNSTVIPGATWRYTPDQAETRFTLAFSQPEKLTHSDQIVMCQTIAWNAPPPAK